MKMRSYVRSAACIAAILAIGSPLSAQGPGGRGAAPGGRGGGRAPSPPNADATPAQFAAVDSLNGAVSQFQNAVMAARTALLEASLNGGDVQARARDLGTAELNAALARANGLASIQAGPNRFDAKQLEALSYQAANAGGGRGGFTASEPLDLGDLAGFRKIFDGETLNGWDGPPGIWFVDDGAISARGGNGTTYIIWDGGKVRDFELKLEVKVAGANTGIQYRSRRTIGGPGRGGQGPEATPEQIAAARAQYVMPAAVAEARGLPVPANAPAGNPNYSAWNLGGYQFDLGGNNNGQLYEQAGRGIVVYPGEIGELSEGLNGPRHRIIGFIGNPNVLPTTDEAGNRIPGVEKVNDWNQVHLIAKGNVLIHMQNGMLTSVSVDNDPNYQAFEGVLAFQIEGGGQLWFRNIYIKDL